MTLAGESSHASLKFPYRHQRVLQDHGSLLGTKTIMNEIYAFIELSKTSDTTLSPHSRLIMVYALCGFANLSSIGIQIGGLGTMAPERRKDIISLGFKSVLAGTLSTMLSGTIMGLLSYIH